MSEPDQPPPTSSGDGSPSRPGGDRPAEPDEPDQPNRTESIHRAAEARGYTLEILGARAVRVHGRFSEPTFAALEVMLEAPAPVGVWASGVDGGPSALCLWTGQDLYAITLGVGGKWEHFRPDQGLALLRDSWRENRARFRVPHGALMKPLPDAVSLAEEWGFETPTTAPATPPPAAAPARAAGRPGRAGTAGTTRRAPRTPRATPTTTGRAAKPEPTLRFCPTCFMALPATGVCDYCA